MSFHNLIFELLPRAELLGGILMKHPCVSGVALTGSLARNESCIHDIDLVVFHDDGMTDGSSNDPQVREFSYDNQFSLNVAVGDDIAEHLSHARRGVPVNYIWVHEKALWSCNYLQALERSENFPDFYLTVFRQIPLVLVDYNICRGTLRRYISRLPHFRSRRDHGRSLFFNGMFIEHDCYNLGCTPRKSWEERKREIKERKGPCPRDIQLASGQA